MVERNTAMLIADYNNTELQLAALSGAEQQMQTIDRDVANMSAALHHRQGMLSKTQQDDMHLQKRIHRNSNPRFFHYLVCNRDAKVERLKGELQDLVGIEQNLSNKIAEDSGQLSTLRQTQQNSHTRVDKKHQLESHCRAVFDQVVNAQPPTQTLQQLWAGVQQHGAQMASEQGLLQAIDRSVQLVQQGLSLFQQAEGLYNQAHRVNQQAKQTNRAEVSEERRERREEAFGNDFGAERSEWRIENLEREERHLQARRDSLINQAHDVAMQAYQVISAGLSAFPMEARARYPQLCASIGQVAFPRVEGANFNNALLADMIFGTTGAAMNDYRSGCKIQNNIRVVAQCASITSQQLGLLGAMKAAVTAAVQQLQVSLQSLEQNIKSERNAIFHSVRAAVPQ